MSIPKSSKHRKKIDLQRKDRTSRNVPSRDGLTPKRANLKIVLIGVGNVASALVQALQSGKSLGVWHEKIGGFLKDDISIVGAFDIDKRKVGKDLFEGIFASPNVTPHYTKIHSSGILIRPGIVNEEIPGHLLEYKTGTENFLEFLKSCSAGIVLNLIPSGMQQTSIRYAKAARLAGCSFINAAPATIASDPKIEDAFRRSKLVLAGDDLLSQFGGTAFHKGILEFMDRRGLILEKSYQLDVGGGSETLNTINEEIKLDKRDIKTEAISGEIPYGFNTIAGTTDFVDYMGNNRTSYFWIEARTVFGSKVNIDVYLRTNDGANAVNILLDVIRAVARAKLRKRFGANHDICAYGFKKLPSPLNLRIAQNNFIANFA